MQEPVVVSRNGVDKTLERVVFGKKSPNKGKPFWAPSVTPDTLQKDIEWIGFDDTSSMLSRSLRQIFADIYVDNIDETTGEFNEQKYLLDIADFSGGVEKLSEIEEQLEEYYAVQQACALDDEFGVTDDSGALTEKAQELQKTVSEIALKIKPLKVKKADIEKKYADRAAKRKARKEAEAAKPAAVAA